MLVGREAECRELARLLRSAADGKSGSLVIRGEAGMGKTALLAYAAHRAERSFLVLAARGVQAESELAFAGLVGLCRPLARYMAQVPGHQRSALEAAIAFNAAPVPHRLAASAGFLSLVGVAAENRAVLLLVDDLQWVDRSSAEAILFVARRLGPDHVAIVMAAREHEVDGVDTQGIDEMILAGLDRKAGRRLLETHPRGTDIAPDVAERLVDLTGGAPLALVEVPSLLSDAQLQGTEPLPQPLPAGDGVREAFRREISGLPRRTIQALRVAAADDVGALDAVQEALVASGLSLAALEPAERRGLLQVDGRRAEFRHPLLRSVVYHSSTPAERRRAHRALAAAYAARDPVRHAWHRAAAATGPDESIASALEVAAGDATARGGHGSAAMALERAAGLTPERASQARRRFQAGMAALLGLEPRRAGRNLDQALAAADDPLLRADIQRARARLLATTGSLLDAYALLVDEAIQIEGLAPDRAVSMLTDACAVCTGAAFIDRGLEAASRAVSIARRASGESQLLATLALVHPLILGGRTKVARRLLRTCKAAAAGYFHPPLMRPFDPIVGTAFVYEDHAFAMRLLDTFHEAARARAPDALPQVLATLAHVEIHTGDLPLALAHATEASELSGVIDQGSSRAFALATRATAEAAMGRDQARAHAEQALEVAGWTATRSMVPYSHHAVGLLELGSGRLDEAIPALEETGRLLRAWGVVDPLVIPWMPNLVEAYVHAGRRSAASALAAELNAVAKRTGLSWAHAVSARCNGLVDDDFDDHFRHSLRLLDGLPTAFDRARTELAYAERLRRVGRRRDARGHLHAAIETFRRMGATPWAARAEAELGGTAEHLRSRQHPVDHLSPQELHVALLVSEGKTNREVAAALFVTAKTVEYHLGNVYRKLGIHSRNELTRVMATRDVSTAATPATPSG